MKFLGQVSKWSKGADCKSVGFGLREFDSLPVHQRFVSATIQRFIGADKVEPELTLLAETEAAGAQRKREAKVNG